MPLPRVVELVRVSTKGQADRDTPEMQRRALDELRVRRPGEVVERIEAPGISGALPIEQRPDLLRLAELSRTRSFDELRVYDVDRLTRAEDPRARFAVYGMALDAGAVIVDAGGRVIDPADSGGMGELDWYLRTLFAARERQRFKKRTHDGRMRCLAEGHLCQGSPPFGRRYDRASRAWTLYEPEVAIYRRIIAEVLEGRSTYQIVDGLNADRLTPTRGATWSTSTIKRLVHAPAAVGRYVVLGKTTEIPPVVDEETWRAARTMLTSRRARPDAGVARPALLRGVLFCGSCGRPANVLSWHAGDPGRYGCVPPRRLSQGAQPCPERKTWRIAAVDEVVRDALLLVVTDPRLLRAAAEQATGGMERARWEAQSEGAAHELQRLRDQEERLLRLMGDGLVSDEAGRARLGELRAARTAQESRQEAARVGLDASLGLAGADLEAVTGSLARRAAGASAEDLARLVRLLFPRRPPYGLRLHPDGRLEGTGRVPMTTGAPVQSSARSVRCPGVPFRIETMVA